MLDFDYDVLFYEKQYLYHAFGVCQGLIVHIEGRFFRVIHQEIKMIEAPLSHHLSFKYSISFLLSSYFVVFLQADDRGGLDDSYAFYTEP